MKKESYKEGTSVVQLNMTPPMHETIKEDLSDGNDQHVTEDAIHQRNVNDDELSDISASSFDQHIHSNDLKQDNKESEQLSIPEDLSRNTKTQSLEYQRKLDENEICLHQGFPRNTKHSKRSPLYDHESDSDNNPHDSTASALSDREHDKLSDHDESLRIYPTRDGAPDSKYKCYSVLVDPQQDDRAVEIALCSMARPHMRCFHCAWISFFVAFLCWFAIAPLLSEVTVSLGLSKEQIWTSNMLSVTGSAILRVVIGPLCDKYGARLCSAGILFVTAVPTMALGLANTFGTFSMLRLIIGMAGATFVTGQYWTSSIFTREVAGTANALVAGWGNLGGGITQILMGSVFFPFFRWMYKGRIHLSDIANEIDEKEKTELAFLKANDRAWRSVPVIPGLVSLVASYFFYRFTDDSPKGNYHKRKKQGYKMDVKVWEVLLIGAKDPNTWLLFLQYGCCFGVELTVSNAAALYFKEEFKQSTESAAAIASIFGWMNLFARGLGGFMSDMCNAWDGMRGRLAWQSVCLLCEGLTTILFAYSKSLTSSIFTLALFSLFVQATEGSTFGIVPYVNPKITGSIVGIVGAGGNVGGICFSYLFRVYSYEKAFVSMGWCVVVSSLLSFFVLIRGHAGLTCGKDSPEVRTALRRKHDQSDENSFGIEGLEISQPDSSYAASYKTTNDNNDTTKANGVDVHVVKVISLTKNSYPPADITPLNQEYFKDHANYQSEHAYSNSNSSISSHSKEDDSSKVLEYAPPMDYRGTKR